MRFLTEYSEHVNIPRMGWFTHNLLKHGLVLCVNPAQQINYDLFTNNKPQSEAMVCSWLINLGFF